MTPAFLYYHCSTHNSIGGAVASSPPVSNVSSAVGKLSLDVRQPPVYCADGSMLCLIYESSSAQIAGSPAG